MDNRMVIEYLFRGEYLVVFDALNGYLSLVNDSIMFKSYDNQYSFRGNNEIYMEALLSINYNYYICNENELELRKNAIYGIPIKYAHYIDTSEEEKKFIKDVESIYKEIEQKRKNKIVQNYNLLLEKLNPNLLLSYQQVIDYEKNFKKELRIAKSKVKVDKFIDDKIEYKK